MTLTREAASAALARVESDPAALERFLAAYRGDEDAVAALQEAADPARRSPSSRARDERLKDLERAAYSRAATPDEEVAAAHASDEIVWELDHRRAIADALEVAVRASEPPAPAPVASAAVIPDPVEQPRRKRLPTRAVIAIAVVAGLLVGGAVAEGIGHYFRTRSTVTDNALTSSPTPHASATPSRAPVATTVTRTYTTQQIAGWFAATSTSDDTFPEPSYLSFIGLGSNNTRFIATSDKGWSLWIAKSTAGETCLVMNGTVQGQQIGSVSSCLSDKAIGQSKALVINTHGIDSTLTARDLVVALTAS